MNVNNKSDVKNWCRICSGPGLYDVYGRIPFYLHSSLHEFQQWIRPINLLIEDITGCNVSAKNNNIDKC